MNQTDALQRLDEIQELDPDPTIDIGALRIMEELAGTPSGLHLLVVRYGSSPSAHIAGFLALVLAKQADHSTPETASEIFDFVGRLNRKDYDGALVSSLTAMQKQIGFGASWGNSPHPPSSLFPFLKHCLSYTGQHHHFVQWGAVELITVICCRYALSTVFEIEEIKWMRERIDELDSTDNTLLATAIVEFRECCVT